MAHVPVPDKSGFCPSDADQAAPSSSSPSARKERARNLLAAYDGYADEERLERMFGAIPDKRVQEHDHDVKVMFWGDVLRYLCRTLQICVCDVRDLLSLARVDARQIPNPELVMQAMHDRHEVMMAAELASAPPSPLGKVVRLITEGFWGSNEVKWEEAKVVMVDTMRQASERALCLLRAKTTQWRSDVVCEEKAMHVVLEAHVCAGEEWPFLLLWMQRSGHVQLFRVRGSNGALCHYRADVPLQGMKVRPASSNVSHEISITECDEALLPVVRALHLTSSRMRTSEQLMEKYRQEVVALHRGGKKEEALRRMKKRKLLSRSLDVSRSVFDQLTMVSDAVQGVEEQGSIMRVLEQSTKELGRIIQNKNLRVEDVDAVMEDLQSVLEEGSLSTSAMSEPVAREVHDEKELEEELDHLLAELRDESIDALPSAPVGFSRVGVQPAALHADTRPDCRDVQEVQDE